MSQSHRHHLSWLSLDISSLSLFLISHSLRRLFKVTFELFGLKNEEQERFLWKKWSDSKVAFPVCPVCLDWHFLSFSFSLSLSSSVTTSAAVSLLLTMVMEATRLMPLIWRVERDLYCITWFKVPWVVTSNLRHETSLFKKGKWRRLRKTRKRRICLQIWSPNESSLKDRETLYSHPHLYLRWWEWCVSLSRLLNVPLFLVPSGNPDNQYAFRSVSLESEISADVTFKETDRERHSFIWLREKSETDIARRVKIVENCLLPKANCSKSEWQQYPWIIPKRWVATLARVIEVKSLKSSRV